MNDDYCPKCGSGNTEITKRWYIKNLWGQEFEVTLHKCFNCTKSFREMRRVKKSG